MNQEGQKKTIESKHFLPDEYFSKISYNAIAKLCSDKGNAPDKELSGAITKELLKIAKG